MAGREKIEGYLIELGVSYEEVGSNAWLINDEARGLEQVVVILEEPVVIFRVKVMAIPEKDREKCFETLLRLNAQDVIHGAYALDGSDVIMVDTLVFETLDREEFQASLDSIGLALTQHYPVLREYR
jgi:hypothetical protein